MQRWHKIFLAGAVVTLAGAFVAQTGEIRFGVNETDRHDAPLVTGQTPSPTPSPSPFYIPLRTIPADVRGIYFTSWSASLPDRMARAIELGKTTEVNAVVIDVKDFTGKVAFETENPLIKRIGSEEKRIANLRELVNTFHAENIYVAVRIAVFQDQHLVKVRPDLAVKDAAGNVWRDRKGLGWVDPASREAWEYNLEVAKEAAKAGADELNFDYIRFPSDGNLVNIRYPVYDSAKRTKREVIREFFAFLHEGLKPTGKVVSADLFGLSTVNKDDLGIGQVIEDAFPYFDYIAPMVYPSHYAAGFLGYKNPAAHPYEVIKYSLENAKARREKFAEIFATSTLEGTSPELREKIKRPEKIAEIRPWLQAFDLGASYPPEVIRKEIQAVYDVGLTHGWYLWNPSNVYSTAIFEKK